MQCFRFVEIVSGRRRREVSDCDLSTGLYGLLLFSELFYYVGLIIITPIEQVTTDGENNSWYQTV